MLQHTACALCAMLLASFIFTSGATAAPPPPLEFPFNTTDAMGPDGPWNFITLSVGSGPSSQVSFFPQMEDPYTFLATKSSCAENISLCQPNAEYYDSSATSAKSNAQDLNLTRIDAWDLYGDISNTAGFSGTGYYWLETLNAPINFSNITAFIADNVTGKIEFQSYKPISGLSLERNNYRADLNLTSGDRANTTTIVQESNRAGRSESFSLHMGAAAFGQSGSLYTGGYDSNRVIYPRLTSTEGFELDGITFGTSSGDSPPWLMPPGNFVTTAHPTIGGLRILPHVPYIYLPHMWCNAMAASLPVDYDSETNLYIWRTSDPAFHDIMTSPTFMNFTFKANGQVSWIRVPFATLNLTLGPPLKTTPVQYFPCYGREDVIALGRAFLQSVLYTVAWTPSGTAFYMAQAPGPSVNKNTKPNVVAFAADNPVMPIPSGAPSWEESWAGVLKPLEKSQSPDNGTSNDASNNTGSSIQSSSISGRIVAGAVIGTLLAVALLAAAVWYFVVRSRRQRLRSLLQRQPQQQQQHQQQQQQDGHSWPGSESKIMRLNLSSLPAEASSGRASTVACKPAEMWSTGNPMVYKPAEMSDTGKLEAYGSDVPEKDADAIRYEMAGTARPAELPGSGRPPPPPPPKD